MTRCASGMSITELLVSCLLMGICMSAIGELVVLNTIASTKIVNSVDGQVGCSRALRRIGEDIRAAQVIGNVDAKSITFPDKTNSLDPYSSTPPQGGWPWGASYSQPYVLGPQTLILQQPVYDPNKGFPLVLAATSNGVSTNIFDVDTVIYHIVQDPVISDTYQLQVARFPGNPSMSASSVRPAINPPQVVLTGIVGPTNPQNASNLPEVFQYLSTASQSVAPVSNPVQLPLGVSINLEVRTPVNGAGANVRYAGAHIESYLKASQYMKLTNP